MHERLSLLRPVESYAISPDELAHIIVAGLDGLILQYLADRDTERAERDLNTLITAVTGLAEVVSSSSHLSLKLSLSL